MRVLAFVMIAIVFPLPSRADGGKYSCTSYVETGSTRQFDVAEGKPDGNLDFNCLVRHGDGGKRVLECKQHVWGDKDPSNPIRIVVDFGSDISFEGQIGMQPDGWNGYIWPRNSSLTCVFSK